MTELQYKDNGWQSYNIKNFQIVSLAWNYAKIDRLQTEYEMRNINHGDEEKYDVGVVSRSRTQCNSPTGSANTTIFPFSRSAEEYAVRAVQTLSRSVNRSASFLSTCYIIQVAFCQHNVRLYLLVQNLLLSNVFLPAAYRRTVSNTGTFTGNWWKDAVKQQPTANRGFSNR